MKRRSLRYVRRLNPGDTVYCILRSVSRSGMSRVIQLLAFDKSDSRQPDRHIGYLAAKAMNDRYDRDREGIKIGGCGMDMGFALVSNLSATLFREGFDCTGESCPSNEHSNAWYSIREGTCPCCGEKVSGKSEGHHIAKPEDWGNDAHGHTVCKTCAETGRVWHHKSGEYALQHRWL